MKTNRELLSIFVPTYKRPDYLKDCLDSIVTQAKKFEIDVHVSDNCSQDQTKGLVESYQKQYERVHYRVQSETVPLDRNQIMFMNFIDSEYCLMIADDDAITENCLESLLRHLKEKPKTELILLNADHYCEKLKEKERSNFFTSENQYFDDGREFFKEYFFKMHFSTIVVNMTHIKSGDEEPYMGTYHAYCGVAFESLKRQYEVNGKNEVAVWAEPLVILRNGSKTYSHERLKVEYDIFASFFFKVPEFYREVAGIKLAEHTKRLSRLKFLLKLRNERSISIQNIKKLWIYMNAKDKAKMYFACLVPIILVEALFKLKVAIKG